MPADAQAAGVQKWHRSVRLTAVLTALLGPMMIGTAVMSWSMLRLLAYLQRRPGMPALHFPPQFELMVTFTERSALITLALGLVFLVGAVWALRREDRRAQILAQVASLGILGMLLLAVMWCWVVLESPGADPLMMSTGVIAHLLQAGLIYGARRTLVKGPPVAPQVS